ncbi:TPA: hypothetical protein N0F65_000718 [Lagenidium giganteum]|uniref:Uncharacterized protein n=1 Tax=Lagenidium giganteum TaxID=4803 RepID=A0AAV2ZQK5_9STRA|nr:TPA: hypothetical protein N0F65_000718 [Lagenidium giganteum]
MKILRRLLPIAVFLGSDYFITQSDAANVTAYSATTYFADTNRTVAAGVAITPAKATCAPSTTHNGQTLVTCFFASTSDDVDAVLSKTFGSQPYGSIFRFGDTVGSIALDVKAVVADGSCVRINNHYYQARLNPDFSVEISVSADNCRSTLETFSLTKVNKYQSRTEMIARNMEAGGSTSYVSTTPAPTSVPNTTASTTQAPSEYTPYILPRCRSNVVALQSDTGGMVAICRYCTNVQKLSESAMLNTFSPVGITDAQWYLWRFPNGKVSLQNVASGKFLGRCPACYDIPYAIYYDTYNSAFVHVEKPAETSSAQFDLVDVRPGFVAFRSDVGQYLTRCSNCVSSHIRDALFVKSYNPFADTSSQFKVFCR